MCGRGQMNMVQSNFMAIEKDRARTDVAYRSTDLCSWVRTASLAGSGLRPRAILRGGKVCA